MPISLSVTGLSDIGKIRRRNEDSITLVAELGVAVVADGMGGHPGGDVASGIASKAAAGVLAEAIAEGGDGDFAARLRPVMESAIREAHLQIRSRGAHDPDLEGMGTTLTAMAVDSATGAWMIGHVGDSRAYLFRDGELTQLTRDDTWIQQQIERGDMQPEHAKRSPYAHLLTQCVGLDEIPTPQLLEGQADEGDSYLLCTDGLVSMLDDDVVQRILRETLSGNGSEPEGPLEELLQAANDAGGHDNITAAFVRYGER